VLYTPDFKDLARAIEAASRLSESPDPLAGSLGDRFERLRRNFFERWGARLGLSLEELREILDGEALIGWTPSGEPSKQGAFSPGEWVVVARRRPESDPAIARLWRKAAARAAKNARTVTRRIRGAEVEEILWETTTETRISPKRRPKTSPRRPGRNPAKPIPPQSFGRITRVERQALSLARRGDLLFFAPGRAERLAPWIEAAAVRPGTGGAGDLGSLAADVAGLGRPVLLFRAIPPAWVPHSWSATERRLGGNPGRVFLSQVREVEGAASFDGKAFFLECRARVLPPPGWIARTAATLAGGATLSAPPDRCDAELAVCADFARLWATVRGVLGEGWPAVGGALDSFLAPLGGGRGEGAALLAATLGAKADFYLFPPETAEGERGGWAAALDLRDPEEFARFQPRLERLLATFSSGIAHYALDARGRLIPAEGAPTSPTLRFAPRLHLLRARHRFFIASDRASLEKTLQLPSPPRGRGPTGNISFTSGVVAFAEGRQSGLSPAIVARYVARNAQAGPTPLGGKVRRTIRTPGGTFELISPPRPGERVETKANRPRTSAARRAPRAEFTWGLFVESEKTLLLRVGLEIETGPPAAAPNRPPRLVPKRPTIQE